MSRNDGVVVCPQRPPITEGNIKVGVNKIVNALAVKVMFWNLRNKI